MIVEYTGFYNMDTPEGILKPMYKPFTHEWHIAKSDLRCVRTYSYPSVNLVR